MYRPLLRYKGAKNVCSLVPIKLNEIMLLFTMRWQEGEERSRADLGSVPEREKERGGG